ncbi:hypothetical protein lerEdw1_012956 [Lerista edwardsae]|nr:hypothetical protein lerEdw1_012956 [Lerista edwardsae]
MPSPKSRCVTSLLPACVSKRAQPGRSKHVNRVLQPLSLLQKKGGKVEQPLSSLLQYAGRTANGGSQPALAALCPSRLVFPPAQVLRREEVTRRKRKSSLRRGFHLPARRVLREKLLGAPPFILQKMADLSDVQLSASEAKKKKKKKKKKKRELRKGLLSAEAASSSFVFSEWDDKPGEACKKKKNRQREASDSQLDAPCVSMESEVASEADTGILPHKKKKKKKRAPVEPDDAELLVRVPQEKTSASPRMDTQEEVWPEGTRVRKKRRKKALCTDQAETSAPSPSRQAQIEPSSPEDTQTELFTSSPPSQHSSLLFQGKKRGGSNLDTSRELGSPLPEKKSRRKRKRSRAEESDTPDGPAAGEGVGLANRDLEGNNGYVRRKRKTSRAEESDTPDSLAVEEGVGLANRDSQRPRSSPKQGTLEGNNGSAYSPTPVSDAEKELSPTPSCAQSVSKDPFLDSSEVSECDLDAAVRELEAFIPHVRSLSDATIRQLAQRDLVRFRNFQKEGAAVKFGRFSRKENHRLVANVEAFLETYGIETAEKLFFPDRFPEETQAIRKLKAKHLFGVRIAEGIPRPWRQVYFRAKKVFDPQNSNKDSVSLMVSEPNFGSWSREEVKRLICAVGEWMRSKVRGLDSALEEGDAEKALRLMGKKLYKGISWTEVEAKVGTRHWRQCKHKWMSIVTKRMSREKCISHGRESVQAKVNLIERMYELDIEDASEIDWEDLASALGNVPPDYVQRRFCKLKVRYVPSWNRRCFPEIIDHLYEVTLPKFKKQLLKRKKNRRTASPKPSQEEKSGQKRTYTFSDIFCDEDSENETSKPASEEVDFGSQKDSESL